MHPRHHAQQQPDKPAFIMAASGHVVTYAELEDQANRIAQLYRTLGLKNGDHIAVMLANEALYLPVVWAAQRSGLVFTCISTHLNDDDAQYILNDCKASALVTSSTYAKRLGDTSATILLVDADDQGSSDLRYLMDQHPAEPIADEQAGVDMLYSSGTTGRPKGVAVQLDGAGIEEMLPVMKGLAQLYGIDGDTVYLSTAPLYHAAPLRFNMLVMSMGGTCVIMDRFDGETALSLIEQHRITHSQWVPIMFSRMLKAGLRESNTCNLASHRVAIHAAAPCPPDVKQAMIDWWGPILNEYYSSTEGIGFTAIDSRQWLQHPGSVGRAVVGEIRIVGEDGGALPVGEPGQVFFAGGPAFHYFGDEEKTAEATNAEGWYTVGDIGYTDEEGFLYLTDRQSFMIISGGVNIYPQEIESVLITHPGVSDVAVFGVPSEQFGEEVKAVVEPAPGCASEAELRDTLMAFCRERLSGIKCPRSIDFDDALPRLPNGKLYKKQLRARYWS
ncbi:AMP-binding protein [Parahaliea aestuarii]|uniref:AMP-binding protein n=1 Tax=Parahaliea aestuarii TaxID=1852021 RepID=A0A5C8ZP90_9GAMM|nr:AMP-binding protein [Parahaliea aestuarii]TXS89191.1 AMP-binding protein [Parahaliea aestuarii]